MRGLAFFLACSVFVNSGFGGLLNSNLPQQTTREVAIEEVTVEKTVSESDVSQADASQEEVLVESLSDNETQVSAEEPIVVKETAPVVVEQTDDTVTILNESGERENFRILGKTSKGYRYGVKTVALQDTSVHLKSFERAVYNWDALDDKKEILNKAEKIQAEIAEGSQLIFVSSEMDMLALAALSEQGETFKGIEIVQQENIPFSMTFPGIGFVGDTAEKFGFQGTFDGNGYVFYGLEHIADQGLFQVIGKYGVVKNVTLLAGDLYLKEGEFEFFNPLGVRNAGIITNCHLEGNITAEHGIVICGYVRGNVGTISDSSICGTINAQNHDVLGFAICNVAGGKIINCYNHCDIYTTPGAGHISGITGLSQGTILQWDDEEMEYIDTLSAGIFPRDCFPEITSEEVQVFDTEKYGIFYYISPTIKDCYNYGDIKTESSYLAGIVEQISPASVLILDDTDPENVLWMGYDMYGGKVEHCMNFGDITGVDCIGGIVTQYSELITQCANYGAIKGGAQLGGIAGSGMGFADELGIGIIESVNFGDITGNRLVGGIAGDALGKFHDNYNRGNISHNEAAAEDNYILGGLAGMGDGRGLFTRGYSTGTVSDMSIYCNGLFGRLSNSSATSKFYLTGESTDRNSKVEKVTEEWLKSDEAVAALGSCFKKDALGINDGYPILHWQAEKENKMKVRFVTMGGSEVASQYVYGGDTLTAPKAPVKEGAEFEGWYTDAAYTLEWDFSKTVEEPMCLYAKWDDPFKEKQWKVTISTAGGEYDSAYGYPSFILAWDGALLEEIETPVRVNYRFLGWGVDGSTTDFWDFEKDRVTKDMALEAVWQEEDWVCVNLVYCGADDVEEKNNVFFYGYAQKLELQVVTKKNHEFGGWFTQENGKGTQYMDGMRIYEDVTLYAYWISNERYTVTFDSMGGSVHAAVTDIIPGNCIELPTPTKANSVFVGWYTEPEGEGSRFTNMTPVTESLTLYAFWKEDTITGEYRIVAIPNQTYTGSKVTPKVTVYQGSKVLGEGKDYTVTYVNCVEAGNATARIKLADKTIKINYLIIEKNIQDEDVSVWVSNSTLNNQTFLPETPMVEVCYKEKELRKSRDYRIKVNAGNAKQATLVITGKGNFTGTREVSFEIVNQSLNELTVKPIEAQTYTGEALEPKVEIVTAAGRALTEGKDYECIYTNNVNSGKATVELRGIGAYAGSRSVDFTITKKPIAAEDILVTLVSPVVYDGVAKKVEVTVEYNGVTLKQGTDYTVKYSNNTKASDRACVTIKGKGNYNGQRKEYFTILRKNIQETDIYVEDGKYQNGKEVKPKVTVKDGKKTLQKNKDYEVTYSNNKERGEASVIITGKGNYRGTATEQKFRIVSEMITKAKIEKITAVTYDGGVFKPEIKAFYKGALLTEGEDYVIQYPAQNNQNAGKGVVYVIGQGIFGGKKAVFYTINKRALNSEDVDFVLQKIENQTYTGTQVKPQINLSYKGVQLKEGKDYKLRYQKNVNASEKAVVIIQGMGNFKGTWKEYFTILPAKISDANIVAQDVAYKKGKASVPKLTIKFGNKKLKIKKDYVISYESNLQCQDSVVTIKGIGNFAGMGEQTVTVPYHVYEVAIGKAKIEKISAQTITEDELLEPAIKLTYEGERLKEEKDYILSFTNNAKAGKATVTIQGIGRFGGTKVLTFQIKQK